MKHTRRAKARVAVFPVREAVLATLAAMAVIAALALAPRADAQVFNSQPYTAAPDPAVEQLRQRIEQLEVDLKRAIDRAEVLGAQLSDARRVADEANAGRKKAETEIAALRDRVDLIEDHVGGAPGDGAALSNTTGLQSADAVALPGANPVPAPAVDLAALPQDETGFFDSAHALLLGGDFAASQRAFASYLDKYPKGSKAGDAQYYLAESMLYQDNYTEAVSAYGKVIKSYGSSPNAATSMVKMARAMRGLGKTADACKTLEMMGKQFPKASAVAKQMAAQERQYAKCS